jgi:predicted ATP-grasp superfamily ATP-dependent carboligase
MNVADLQNSLPSEIEDFVGILTFTVVIFEGLISNDLNSRITIGIFTASLHQSKELTDMVLKVNVKKLQKTLSLPHQH